MTITTVTLLKDFGVDTRLVGYYTDIEDARTSLLKNGEELSGGSYYTYVILEVTEPGLYPKISNREWYAWDEKLHQYNRIEEPIWGRNGVFSIG
jgi:hypothetical protein